MNRWRPAGKTKLIKNTPNPLLKGNYTKGHLNKGYAVKAVHVLKDKSLSNSSPKELWDLMMSGQVETPDSQMDVVLSLCDNGLINTE